MRAGIGCSRVTRGLALLALVAGCESSAFVDIRISAPAGVERVDLFIAPNICQPGNQVPSCANALSWDESSRKVPGEIYILDVDATTTATRLDDGTFRIDLKTAQPPPSDNPNHVARMLFVGYADPAGDTATSAAMLDYVDLPLKSAQQWHVELTDVVAVPPVKPTVTKPAADADRLHFWNRSADTLARCVVFERWRDGNVERDFLVPPGDTDCDDKQNECDPFWWNAAAKPPAPVDATCLTRQYPLAGAPGTVGGTCQPGGLACSETGAAGTDVCTPVSPLYCLTGGFCSPACASDLSLCIENGSIAHVRCTIPHNDLGRPCTGDDSAEVDLSLLGGSNPNLTCDLPRFARIMPPLTGFMNPTMLGSVGLLATASLQPILSGCTATLTWSGDMALDHYQVGAIAVRLSNDTTAVIGLVLDFGTDPPGTSTCNLGASMMCTTTISTNDDATHCAEVP